MKTFNEIVPNEIIRVLKRSNGKQLVQLSSLDFAIIGKDFVMILNVDRSRALSKWYDLVSVL